MKIVATEKRRNGTRQQRTYQEGQIVHIGSGKSKLTVLPLTSITSVLVFAERNVRVRNRTNFDMSISPDSPPQHFDMVHPRTTNSSVSIKVIT